MFYNLDKCYIETANVDGETNLKLRESVKIPLNEAQHIKYGKLKGSIKCEAPNANLYNFNGVYTSNSDMQYPLSTKNFLIRGCTLKRSEYVIGVVVYTGKETKVMNKKASSRLKVSSLDRRINTYLFVIILVQILLCIFTSILKGSWEDRNEEKITYLMFEDDDLFGKTKRFFGDFFVTFILISNFVPISLYVTIEIIHYIFSKFIEHDEDMVHKNIHAIARNSNLHEEIGQVEYVFSDKTGTLTDNEMIYRLSSINGQVYAMDTKSILFIYLAMISGSKVLKSITNNENYPY